MTTLLEHQKLILDRVKEDSTLFEKELIKSIKWLSEDEKKELKIWVMENFYDEHSFIIDEVFTEIAA